jgi:hypothetical protein
VKYLEYPLIVSPGRRVMKERCALQAARLWLATVHSRFLYLTDGSEAFKKQMASLCFPNFQRQ